jgi:CelD/BcsL family acetyltransferase involved in cellulose biosynthesis
MTGRGVMRAGLVTRDDPAWPAALSRVHHDLYHLPAFAELAARWHAPGTPAAFLAEEKGRTFLVPLIVRSVPAELSGGAPWLDATGPRGYPGPVVGPPTADVDETFVDRAIAALLETLRATGIVAAFIRCHPLLSPRLEILSRWGGVQEHGESVSIDLADSAEQVWHRMRDNHRRSISRARREGYEVRIDEGWERLEEFVAVYATTMERLGAAGHWRLPGGYFADLRTAVGPAVHLCVVEHAGELAAAAILTEVDGVVEYHLSGTDPAHVHASPTKLLIEEASRWARERGNRVFHLAGSLDHDDSLIHFKRGFSPLRHPVASWWLVADPATYALLVDRSEQLRTRQPVGDRGAFFPRYRLPTTATP